MVVNIEAYRCKIQEMKYTDKKILVVIPAFNEEKNISSVLEELKQYNFDVLVINDCSTDHTEELLKDVNHLQLPVNVGLAGVTQMGFKYAYENNYESAVVIDGDGQHDPSFISSLVKELDEGYDYVIGSRFVTEKKPYTMRMIGSRILSTLIQLKTGKKISDPTSGMRVLGKRVLKEFSENMNFIAEPDAVAYIIKRNYKVKEVQVTMKERTGGVSYFHNPLKSIKYMYDTIISIVFLA